MILSGHSDFKPIAGRALDSTKYGMVTATANRCSIRGVRLMSKQALWIILFIRPVVAFNFDLPRSF